MSASTTSHGQSGFMSVESIGNALFYLIMIAIASLIVSIVMNTGKGGGDLSAISMVRSNVQYVGTNAGNYQYAPSIDLHSIVSLISTSDTLPSGNGIEVDSDSPYNEFTISLTDYDADMCRKYAYYGIGSNFETVTIGPAATAVTLTAANIETQCGAAPLLTPIVLTSK